MGRRRHGRRLAEGPDAAAGPGFNARQQEGARGREDGEAPRAYWGWEEIIASNANGYWPYTPATNLLYGLAEAIDLLLAEGLDNVFARHHRHAEATRRAVRAWGMEVLCQNPAEYSPALTAVVMPKDANGKHHDADAFRRAVLEHFNMSLGTGLGKLDGWVFRIGHLGDFNDLTLMGTLARRRDGLCRCRRAASRGRGAGSARLPGAVRGGRDAGQSQGRVTAGTRDIRLSNAVWRRTTRLLETD